MSIELQKIDCNCNNCAFMCRDIDKFKKSIETHREWQLDSFNDSKKNLLKKAAQNWKKGKYKAAKQCILESRKMKFQFDKKEVTINYGFCSRFSKSVKFIPNTCQIETQNCFIHRNDLFKQND